MQFITNNTIERRKYWIEKIAQLSRSSKEDIEYAYQDICQTLSNEYYSFGLESLLDHIRLCGTIPETYIHDSSEEKLYSKYTDILLHSIFNVMGFQSTVLSQRSDAADVECTTIDLNYSFVADAKAFRMSRTAKNQKDFKIEAVANWKRGKPYAIVVCPIYHLPSRNSQIYQQATTRSVVIFTYSHLAMICRYLFIVGPRKVQELFLNIFDAVDRKIPSSKDAIIYWKTINHIINNTINKDNQTIWRDEQNATIEAIETSRQEALALLNTDRTNIERMTHEQAIIALLNSHNIIGRIHKTNTITDNNILSLI
ncbi:MAG: HindIII family type II restriction endonuclease [Acetobacter sp.]|nr:HindIII family type II restriction endonuclease [Acetobacter sp.]